MDYNGEYSGSLYSFWPEWLVSVCWYAVGVDSRMAIDAGPMWFQLDVLDLDIALIVFGSNQAMHDKVCMIKDVHISKSQVPF
jgi:hypothetical protein